jgi:hypothetical protein
MSIAAGLKDITSLRQGPKCRISIVLEKIAEQHGEDEARQVSLAIDGDEIKAAPLAAYLTEWGYQVTAKSVRYHRNRYIGRGCVCK